MLAKLMRAGFPSPAEDHAEASIDLNRLLVRNRRSTVLVRVDGDSMVGKGLRDGDLAVVDRSLEPLDGDVVVVDIDGERSSKVWSRFAGRTRLTFANPRFPEYRLPPGAAVVVWGVVAGSVSPGRRSRKD